MELCATIQGLNDVEPSRFEDVSENQFLEDPLRNSQAINVMPSSSSAAVYTTEWLTEEAERREVFDNNAQDMLFKAAKEGDEILAKICLNLKRISPNVKDTVETPVLIVAARYGHPGVLGLLLECGATVDDENRYGCTALHAAAHNGHEAAVRVLLERGAIIDKQDKTGETALHSAAWGGHEAVVRVLAEKGATINQQSGNGKTALHIAAGSGHEAVVRVLAEKGATINQQ